MSLNDILNKFQISVAEKKDRLEISIKNKSKKIIIPIENKDFVFQKIKNLYNTKNNKIKNNLDNIFTEDFFTKS